MGGHSTKMILGLLLAAGVGAGASGAFLAATPTRAAVCIKKNNGQVRMLLNRGDTCESSELAMDWTVGGVASVAAGAGLVVGTERGEARLQVDSSVVQSRVSDSCRDGTAISSIAQSGAVSCAAPASCQCPEPPPAPRTAAISGFLDEASIDYAEFPGQIVASLPVPAGNWVIFAKADVMNYVNASGSFGCRLIAVSDTDASDQSWWFQNLENGYGSLSNFVPMAISLNVVHSFGIPNDVLFQCFTSAIRNVDGGKYPLLLQNIKITAIRVDDLTNLPLSQIK